MAPGKTPALDLSTLAPERIPIAIDGANYDLKTSNDFDLLDQNRLERLTPVMQEFADLDTNDLPPDETVARMSTALVEIVEIVLLDCPKEVSDKLNDIQRLQITRLFTEVSNAEITPTTPKTRTPRTRQTTATSSPDSKSSTPEATPADG